MKAAFWRTVWWHLRYPGLPADAAPQAPERRVVDSREAAALFYENDEDPADVKAAFEKGEGGVTAAPHRYLSTGCLHGEHGYCQSNTGSNGTKTPASCKFCGAGCECDCHGEDGDA